MSGLRITKLRRHADGYWTANVSASGTTLPVHNKYGSWQIELARRGATRSLRGSSGSGG